MYIGKRLYLDVPYKEKDEAKRLGAKWDSSVKKWYCLGDEDARKYSPFMKWILGSKEHVLIATDDLYILESKRICWKCKKETTVIALGLFNYVYFEQDDGDIYVTDRFIYYVDDKYSLTLAWVDDEKQIPPLLLNYLQTHYYVKMGYSHIAGKCFANHCEHCGAIQGNNYIFEEHDSPFVPYASSSKILEDKMRKIKIKSIGIDDDLILDWSIYNYSYEKAFDSTQWTTEEPILDNTAFDYRSMYLL